MASGIKRFLSQIDIGGNKLSSLATGTAQTDAVNLGQMQSYAMGVTHFVEVRAASTTAVTLASPGAALDGVTLAANDRILAKNQPTASQNGVYVWTSATAPLVRATDSNSQAALIGQVVTVTEGTVNADKAFIQTTVGTITVDTTALAYAAFLAGATYTGVTGVSVTGTTIAGVAAPSPGGILATAAGFAIDTSLFVRKYETSIGDGTNTTFTVTHNLNHEGVTVQVYDNTGKDTVDVDVVRTSVNVVTVNVLGAVPASNALRVLVQG